MEHEHHLRTKELKRVEKEHGAHRPRMNAVLHEHKSDCESEDHDCMGD